MAAEPLTSGQVVGAGLAAFGAWQVLATVLGFGIHIDDPVARLITAPLYLLVVALGVRGAYLAVNHPSGAAWTMAACSVLCVAGWFTLLVAPVFVAGCIVSAVTAARHPGLDLRVERRMAERPARRPTTGKVAATVMRLRGGGPVTPEEVASALDDLVALHDAGEIDLGSYREYYDALTAAATRSHT